MDMTEVTIVERDRWGYNLRAWAPTNKTGHIEYYFLFYWGPNDHQVYFTNPKFWWGYDDKYGSLWNGTTDIMIIPWEKK